MDIDSFLKIGSSHELCEDSVVIGDKSNPYIIVSDGCSSSKWTHLGSNILTKTAEKIFLETGEFKIKEIIHQAYFIAKSLGLNETALDATLMFAYIKDDNLKVSVYGDGCIFFKQEDNKVSYSLSFNKNMPYYLSYTLNDERSALYQNEVNDEPTEVNKTLKIEKYENENYDYYYDTYFCGFNLTLDTKGLSYLILATDGIESFTNQNNKDIFNEIHNFKNFKGDFLSRRVKRIIKTQKKEGVFHSDDIGVAGFSFKVDEHE